MNDIKKLEEIKKTLEASKAFLYWESESNLTFDDFTIIDLKNEIVVKQGKRKKYFIYIKDDKIESVAYDIE